MTTEKLQQARLLEEQLKNLNSHKEFVKGSHEGIDYNKDQWSLALFHDGQISNRKLKTTLLPIPKDMIVNMYLQNIETEIQKLQTEFDNL